MITAVVSRKGGVGKTTTSVHLAAALAGIGKRTLLVDLDSQASASMSLGVSRTQFAPSIADALLRETSIAETTRPTDVPGLDLITASADLSSFDVDFASVPDKELLLRRTLEPLRGAYDFVFLDCASSVSLLPINALVAADRYLVPIVPNHLSLVGLPNLLATVARLPTRFGTRTELLGIVPTMVDYRLKAHRENLAAVRREFGEKIFAMEIRINTRLAEAPAHGQTVFDYDARATGAKAYRLLAAEVLMRVQSTSGTPDEADAPTSTRIAS